MFSKLHENKVIQNDKTYLFKHYKLKQILEKLNFLALQLYFPDL